MLRARDAPRRGDMGEEGEEDVISGKLKQGKERKRRGIRVFSLHQKERKMELSSSHQW